MKCVFYLPLRFYSIVVLSSILPYRASSYSITTIIIEIPFYHYY